MSEDENVQISWGVCAETRHKNAVRNDVWRIFTVFHQVVYSLILFVAVQHSDINESKGHSLLRGCGSKMAHPLSSSNTSCGAKGRKNSNEQFVSF